VTSESPGASKSKRLDVSLHGGERLVETEDGLFSPDELPEGPTSAETVMVEDPLDVAVAWLEGDLGEAAEVPPRWDAIQAAKASAQELFAAASTGQARQATTAAIQAALRLQRLLEHPEQDDEIPLGGSLPKAEEVGQMLGVLYSNRSLLLLSLIQGGDRMVLSHGPEAAWNLVARDANSALAVDASNFKASYRRARALFELGELEKALVDANQVVDYYARNSSTPNPDAAALRDKILEAIQKERRKWGEKGPARWNRSGCALVTELGGSNFLDVEVEQKCRTPNGTAPLPRPLIPVAPKQLAAPRTGGEIEKVLLSTLRGKPTEQLEYVKDHVSPDLIRRFFRRTPMGPDLLGALVRTLADMSTQDVDRTSEIFAAMAEVPSAKTQASMFDAEEKSCLDRVLAAVGSSAADAWNRDG